MGQLDGRTAVVTGAGSGIGRAAAAALAREGARVVVGDVDAAGAKATVDAITDFGGEAAFVEADVSHAESVQNLVAQAVERYGGLHLAFNNAGVEGDLGPIHQYSESTWNRVIGINLTGVFLSMRYEIPAMLEAGGGAIVNNASVLGLVGLANTPAYTAAKHGVVGLTKDAALTYATQGIRVNAVCPGFTETPMVMERGLKASENAAVRTHLENLAPMTRMGKPEEIANAVVWLCSGASSYVTGQAMTVDGGYTAR